MEFSLGLVEVSALGNAIMMLDDMLKVADVEFVGVERKLGGALVTIVVRGSISAVTASVEAGKHFAKSAGVLKAAAVIARPHPEILKFINLPENETAENQPEEKPKKAVTATKPEKKTASKKTSSTTATKTTKSKAKKASDIKNSPKK